MQYHDLAQSMSMTAKTHGPEKPACSKIGRTRSHLHTMASPRAKPTSKIYNHMCSTVNEQQTVSMRPDAAAHLSQPIEVDKIQVVHNADIHVSCPASQPACALRSAQAGAPALPHPLEHRPTRRAAHGRALGSRRHGRRSRGATRCIRILHAHLRTRDSIARVRCFCHTYNRQPVVESHPHGQILMYLALTIWH